MDVQFVEKADLETVRKRKYSKGNQNKKAEERQQVRSVYPSVVHIGTDNFQFGKFYLKVIYDSDTDRDSNGNILGSKTRKRINGRFSS